VWTKAVECDRAIERDRERNERSRKRVARGNRPQIGMVDRREQNEQQRVPAHRQRTAMVTGALDAVPAGRTTSTASPGVRPDGTVAATTYVPLLPGCSAAIWTSALTPPMVRETGAVTRARGESGAAVPAATLLSTAPSPVHCTKMVSPAAVGLALSA